MQAIRDAFAYAQPQADVPPGRHLWLYADGEGDRHHPWYWPEAVEGMYDAVFLACPKQREEAEGLMALALAHSNGFVMAAAANDAGGGRLRGMMEAYGLPVSHLSKQHCKVVWTHQAGRADAARLAAMQAHREPRMLEMDGRAWWTVPGLFGWDKIDPGSRLLVPHLAGLAGHVADFGCGYGYLSAALAAMPEVTQVDAFDIDARAVACCARNAGPKVTARRQDMRAFTPAPRYDAVVMNPPFHEGKAPDVALGQLFIQNAWQSLKPGGRLLLVANRQLPYETVIPGLGVVREAQGYKIIEGVKR